MDAHDLEVELAKTNGRIDILHNEVDNLKEQRQAGVTTVQWIIGLLVLLSSNLISAWIIVKAR